MTRAEEQRLYELGRKIARDACDKVRRDIMACGCHDADCHEVGCVSHHHGCPRAWSIRRLRPLRQPFLPKPRGVAKNDQ